MRQEEDKGTFTSSRTITDDVGMVFIGLFLDDFDYTKHTSRTFFFFQKLLFSHERNFFSVNGSF